MSGGGVLVGGEPAALLGASSTLYEVASRTDDVGRQLAAALGPAASTVATMAPFAPRRVAAVGQALAAVTARPGAGLGSVFAAYQAVSLQLLGAGQELEAAGAIGLLASGGLGLLRGERPTVLTSAEGVDLRREAVTGSWSVGDGGRATSLAVREVRRPDGSTFFVVEATTAGKASKGAGVQVNGLGALYESATGAETTLRWAVATRRDAELLLALASASMVPLAGRALVSLPKPTEAVLAATASATVVASPGPIPGIATGSATAAVRSEVTTLASGGQRFAASVSGGGQVSLLGTAGTGGAGSVKVTVERNAAGAVTKLGLSTTTEVDRGRHGLAPLEAGNREATLVERELEVELTPEHRAAADRIAAAVASGEAPDRADVDTLIHAAREAKSTERTYDVRHQQASADVALKKYSGGGGAAIDTAVLRQP